MPEADCHRWHVVGFITGQFGVYIDNEESQPFVNFCRTQFISDHFFPEIKRIGSFHQLFLGREENIVGLHSSCFSLTLDCENAICSQEGRIKGAADYFLPLNS